MVDIIKERMTAEVKGDFVVFLIGLRINKLWKIHKWLPVVTAMPKMISELYANPEMGFISHEQWFGRTTIMIQYWKSFEHLENYAKSKTSNHLPAWVDFNKKSLITEMLVFGMKLTYRNQEVTSLCIIICRSLVWRRLWIVCQQPESFNQPAIGSIERTHNKSLHLTPKRFVLMSQVSSNHYMDISKFKNIIWGLLSALSWVTYCWSISMYYSNDEKG